jgi:DNA-binding NarL/FixJ family response regulator
LAEATGAPDVAFDELWKAWQRCTQSGSHAAFAVLGPPLVWSIMHRHNYLGGGTGSGDGPSAGVLDRGDLERARAVAHAVEVLAAANPDVASLEGAALRCRGLVEADVSQLLQASSAYRKAGRLLESALACEDAADVLGRAARVNEARPLFEDVAARYTQMDAAWDAARVASRMRSLGMRRGSRGSRQRSKVGWDALTPSERAVVELVAHGLSNPDIAERLFLSRHTIKAHVSSALAKLQMTSRIELARAAIQRGTGTETKPGGGSTARTSDRILSN